MIFFTVGWSIDVVPMGSFGRLLWPISQSPDLGNSSSSWGASPRVNLPRAFCTTRGSSGIRPLAQLLHEDGLPERLPLFKRDHDELFARMLQLFQRPEEQTATTSVVES